MVDYIPRKFLPHIASFQCEHECENPCEPKSMYCKEHISQHEEYDIEKSLYLQSGHPCEYEFDDEWDIECGKPSSSLSRYCEEHSK